MNIDYQRCLILLIMLFFMMIIMMTDDVHDDGVHPLDINVKLFTKEVQGKAKFHSVHSSVTISINFVKHVPQILRYD